MTNPHICGQCDAENRSCCTLRTENNDGLPVPISESEIIRILMSADHLSKEDILDKRKNTRQFINQMILLFPDAAEFMPLLFPQEATHFELKTKNEGCILKSSDGCILPHTARPHFCKIYPFWFFEDTPYLFEDSNCLALEDNQTIQEALFSLGTNSIKLKQMHMQLCHDWGIHHSIPHEKKRAFL